MPVTQCICPVLVSIAPKYVRRPAWTRWGSLQCSPRPPSWIWGRGNGKWASF